MNPCFFVIVLLHSSLATAVNFKQVFNWPHGLDYEWPSEESRTQALKDRTFKPEKIEPRYMAVLGTRIFLSLYKYRDIPVSLVSLPTSSASSASPKLTPFPSWDMHGKGDCNKIEVARGLEVDSVGRLWVLDSGSDYCNAKLWIFDLSENEHTNRIQRFHFPYRMRDLVLDESPNETLAFISHIGPEHIVVFSLEKNQSWIVETPGIEVLSIALSPKEEQRKLYLSNWNSYDLYSISVDALRNGTQIAYPEQIGKWTETPYRMLIDSHGIMYAAFWQRKFILSWNTSEPFFKKQRFYDVGNRRNHVPFTFALDSSGTFWMTELNKTATKPRYRLLMAAVGAKSYIFETSSVTPTTTTISPKTEPTPVSMSSPTTAKSSTPVAENAATEVQETSIPAENRIIIITLIFAIVLLSLIILWPILGPKMINLFTPQSTDEALQMSALFDYNEDIGPAEE